jgi:PhnB protein
MGNAEEAMNFYKSVFGGQFSASQRYKEIPGGEKMPVADQEKMVHISLTIPGGGVTIMASDSVQPMGDNITFGNNYHICLQAESEAEVDEIFAGLSKNGNVEMPPNKTFWGAYFTMFRDKFGVEWMINYSDVK